jgi:hypothetical protein
MSALGGNFLSQTNAGGAFCNLREQTSPRCGRCAARAELLTGVDGVSSRLVRKVVLMREP